MNPVGSFVERFRIVLDMIRFEHTLFAMPFAFTGMVLAARGIPRAATVIGIVVAMVAARSAAMAFNRLVDREFDARNPRTANRALPAGLVDVRFVRVFIVASAIVFVLASWSLNRLAGWLSPLALAVVLGYSYTKRFTVWCHAVLGLALSIAPVGAWVAVRGTLDWPPAILAAAVVFWLVGFDTLYALQDEDFDRSVGLRSLPVALGAKGALGVARASHAAMIVCLGVLGVVHALGIAFHIAVAIAAAIIVWEHRVVSPTDLRRLNIAFFQANVAVSTVILLGAVCATAAGGGVR